MEIEKQDANWWSFSIDAESRSEKIRTDEAAGTTEVNPDVDGKTLLTYASYLGLDRLLSCQVPGARVPDERIFIITHQLFELVFKQMIFDLGVIAETFRSLLDMGGDEFHRLVRAAEQGGSATRAEEFWLPASTAAARTRHAAGNVMPMIMAYLAREDAFNNDEFGKRFRDILSPASGLQSAQLRLIQRALGKSNLLDIRIFPADTYLKAYEGRKEEELARMVTDSDDAGLVRVVDRLVLQEGEHIATPPEGSMLAFVANTDNLAHEVLVRAALEEREGRAENSSCEAPLLPCDKGSLDAMEERFRGMLNEAVKRMKKGGGTSSTEKRVKVFREDWGKAVYAENERRKAYGASCNCDRLLYRSQKGKNSYLMSMLENLIEADNHFSDGFLSFHRNMVERRIGAVPGTAGGGVLYLDFSRELNKLFPALVGVRKGLEDKDRA